MANATVAAMNATIDAVNATGNATGVESFLSEFVPEVWNRFIDLIIAPWQAHEMLWILTPLVISLIVMQLYFGRYKTEELGWNTAVGNSLMLIFVSVDLFRFLFTNYDYWDYLSNGVFPYGLLVPSLVFGGAIWMLFLDFFHFLPKQFAFFIASSLPINLIAYTAITAVYVQIPFTWSTFAAALMLFITLRVVFAVLQVLVPKHSDFKKDI